MPYRDRMQADTYIGFDLPSTVYTETPADLNGEALHLPVRTASVDAVLCTEMIMLVSDEDALVAELARVLAPGGHLLLTAPFVHGLVPEPHDYRRLTSMGLRTLLTNHGFDVVEFVAVAGTVAVFVDALARSADAYLHAILRRTTPAASRLRIRRLLVGNLFARIAQLWTARSDNGRAWRIDPARPIPRLTLGYAVHAIRRPDDAAMAHPGEG